MRRFGLRIAIVSAFWVGAFVAIFFGFLNHNHNGVFLGFLNHTQKGVTCTGCGMPREGLVAHVSIPKGTSAIAITDSMVSVKDFPQGATIQLAFPKALRGEVAIRTIPAGAPLTAADFALRGPIYYPRGYPKNVPATQIPAKITNSHWLGPPQSGGYVEVAPEVWVDGSTSDAALDEHVANGTLIGYCPSVEAFQAHNREIPFASKCWRRLTPIS
jgi:hypothetical protein